MDGKKERDSVLSLEPPALFAKWLGGRAASARTSRVSVLMSVTAQSRWGMTQQQYQEVFMDSLEPA